MRHIQIAIPVLVFCAAIPLPVLGATIHVPADQPTIQAGIDAALDDDLILVDQGAYKENIDFLGKAVTVQSELGADLTVIDGHQAGSVASFASWEDEKSVLDGFTLLWGSDVDGGGVYCYSSSPTIKNCTITENADSAVGCHEYASPTIINCAITSNTTQSYGGGIAVADYSYPTISGCSITNNVSAFGGAGIDCTYLSRITVEDSEISDNVVTGTYSSGGGIYCGNADRPSVITNCTIARNSAYHGGGIYVSGSLGAVITNSTIVDNEADKGGGISLYGYGSAWIANCTIANNTAITRGGGVRVLKMLEYHVTTVINCILWGNVAPEGYGKEISLEILEEDPTPTSIAVVHSNVEGGEGAVYLEEHCQLFWRNDNIDTDPLFIGETDYHLSAESPCIDAGADIGVCTDIDGDGRPQGAGFDMGSDEFASGDCFVGLLIQR